MTRPTTSTSDRKRELDERLGGVIDPVDEILTVYRWHSYGALDVLIADRTQRVRAEPFQAVDLTVGVLFDDDNDDDE